MGTKTNRTRCRTRDISILLILKFLNNKKTKIYRTCTTSTFTFIILHFTLFQIPTSNPEIISMPMQ